MAPQEIEMFVVSDSRPSAVAMRQSRKAKRTIGKASTLAFIYLSLGSVALAQNTQPDISACGRCLPQDESCAATLRFSPISVAKVSGPRFVRNLYSSCLPGGHEPCTQESDLNLYEFSRITFLANSLGVTAKSRFEVNQEYKISLGINQPRLGQTGGISFEDGREYLIFLRMPGLISENSFRVSAACELKK
jgi:hypothetical protein